MPIRFLDEPVQAESTSIRFTDETPELKTQVDVGVEGATQDVGTRQSKLPMQVDLGIQGEQTLLKDKPKSFFERLGKKATRIGEGVISTLPEMSDPYGMMLGLVDAPLASEQEKTRKEHEDYIASLPEEDQSLIKAGKITGDIAQSLILSSLIPGSGYVASALQGVAGATPEMLKSAEKGDYGDIPIELLASIGFGMGGKAFGELLKKTGKSALKLAIKPSKNLREAGIDLGDIIKFKLGGTGKQIVKNAKKKAEPLFNMVQKALNKNNKNKFDLENALDIAEFRLIDKAKGTKDAILIGDMKKQMSKLRKSLGAMKEEGIDVKNADLKILDAFRAGIGRDTKKLASDQEIKASKKAINRVYGTLREIVDNAIDDKKIRKANKTLSSLSKIRQATEDFIIKNPAGVLQSTVGATTGGVIGSREGGVGSTLGGIAAGAAGGQLLRSPAVGSVIGATGRKLADSKNIKGLLGLIGGKTGDVTAPKKFRGISGL